MIISTDFGGLSLFHFCQLGGGRRRWLQTISVGCGAGCIKEAERKEKLQASNSCVELSSEIIITFYFYYYYYYYYCLKSYCLKKLTKQMFHAISTARELLCKWSHDNIIYNFLINGLGVIELIGRATPTFHYYIFFTIAQFSFSTCVCYGVLL